MAARPSRRGSSSTTCATGSWCGASPTSEPGKWRTSTQTCWARRASGPRYTIQLDDLSMLYCALNLQTSWEVQWLNLIFSVRLCMFTWKLLTSACCLKMRPGPLGRTRWSSSGRLTDTVIALCFNPEANYCCPKTLTYFYFKELWVALLSVSCLCTLCEPKGCKWIWSVDQGQIFLPKLKSLLEYLSKVPLPPHCSQNRKQVDQFF